MRKKSWNWVPRFVENGSKMGSKIYETSSRFRNLRFFDFCDTSPVILRFFEFQGSQNRPQIHQKSMQNRCLKKWCKKVGKWSQHGLKMGAKIGAKSEKDGKRVLQNRCKKMMRKKEASGYRPLVFGGPFLEPAGGLGGTVKPDLIQISFKTPYTRRGAADVFSWKMVPRAPKVRFILPFG